MNIKYFWIIAILFIFLIISGIYGLLDLLVYGKFNSDFNSIMIGTNIAIVTILFRDYCERKFK